MSVQQDLASQAIQRGRVDEQTLEVVLVHLLRFVWMALNTAECVAGHWLTGGVTTLLFMDTLLTGEVLIIAMWMVCL